MAESLRYRLTRGRIAENRRCRRLIQVTIVVLQQREAAVAALAPRHLQGGRERSTAAAREQGAAAARDRPRTYPPTHPQMMASHLDVAQTLTEDDKRQNPCASRCWFVGPRAWLAGACGSV